MSSPPEFDICGALPHNTQVLEASAGTGKTFTVAALATRYVAEGRCGIDQLLLITFTRAATRELRERVRERLVSTHRALTAAAAGDAPALADDEVTRLLAAGSAADVAERRDRLARAISTFDEATITTTHGFCQQTLDRLGLAADTDPLERFDENPAGLTKDVALDLFVARYGQPHFAHDPPFPVATALRIAREVVNDPLADLAAGPVTPGGVDAERQSFAEAVRREHLRRRRQLGITTYDDLLIRVRDAVQDPRTGAAVRATLRTRFPVVMVDEFQDTDPVQWTILRTVFHGHAALVLIGDPKQAIYAFRGGDVVTYLLARRDADHTATLNENRRTDEALVDAVSSLFDSIQLGEGITVPRATSHHKERRLVGGPNDAPFRVRMIPQLGTGNTSVKILRPRVAADVTQDIIRLLTSDAELTTDGVPRPVRPGDIAVLVGRNEDATALQRTLRVAGVNAVVTSNRNVFGSAAAADWLTLLRAMEKPQRTALVRATMITPFFGFTGTRLADEGDEAVDSTAQLIRSWTAQFRVSGIAGVLELMNAHTTHQVLSRPDGERLMTDIRHIGEELHAAGRTTGLAGLIEWLSSRIRDSEVDRDAEDSARRLDTDTAAVQVITIHSSKGLEFPIVYVPYAWDQYDATPDHLRFHDRAGRRIADLRGPDAPGWAENVVRHKQEEAGERLRLLYVAMTRAANQVVTYWQRSANTATSPLQRLLGATLAGCDDPAPEYPPKQVGPAEVQRALGMVLEDALPTGLRLPPPARSAPEQLQAAAYSRAVDTAWRRTSYSALTAATHEAALGADSPSGWRGDEPDAPGEDAVPISPTGRGMRSPMADLPVGATFGLVAHQIYELFDANAGDHVQELRRCAETALTFRPLPDLTPEGLAAAFLPSVRTSLGPLAEHRPLTGFGPRDRLPELDFEYPLAGGDRQRSEVLLRDVAALLRRRLAPADPLARYPDRMIHDGLAAQRLAGFLAGSIDVVLRVTPGDRFLVADYKTNWVGGSLRDRDLVAQDYGEAAMAEAMMAAHYPLQALFYQVALHRYLRWRLPGYDPDRHLGGVLYLFVRGMCGPDTPPTGAAPAGVFQWEPPAALIGELSELLGGEIR